MSRKVPSFGQLVGYIDREEDAERYRIRHNLAARDPELIRHEFERNAALLQKRKNGVYLYHEILSISRAQGLSDEAQKERLYQIAQQYIAARCPDNLVYGGLHHDKEHSFHFHLMISSNRAGDPKRLRLDKAQFRDIQVKLEEHVLREYPELQQKLAIGKRSDRRISRAEAELERRTGERPERQTVLERVNEALSSSRDRDGFISALGRNDLELYVRGKNLGVIDLESGKKHRINTLDPTLFASFEERLLRKVEDRENIAPDGEKEKSAEAEQDRHNTARQAAVNEPQKEDAESSKKDEPMIQKSPAERLQKGDANQVEQSPDRANESRQAQKGETLSDKAADIIRRTGKEIEQDVDIMLGRSPDQISSEGQRESEQQRAWREEMQNARGKSANERDQERE